MQSQSQGGGGPGRDWSNGDTPVEPGWSDTPEHSPSSMDEGGRGPAFNADRRDQLSGGEAEWTHDRALDPNNARIAMEEPLLVDAPTHDAPSAAPWLEPAAEEEVESGANGGRLVALVVAGLALIGLVVGGLYAWQNRALEGDGTLIAAPAGPYKTAPAPERGRFEGEADAAVAATEGAAPVGTVDTSRLPETPTSPTPVRTAQAPAPATATMAAPRGVAAAAPVTRADAAPVASAAPVSNAASAAAAPASAGGTAQLGAFANEASARRAWSQLETRFEWLKDTGHSIVPATVNGRTVYRLTAAGGANLCARLRVAGETCIVR